MFWQALSRLGLISWIGRQTEAVVLAVNEESRLAVAILLILWVSAFASAFVDNIPLTTMMIRIVTNLNLELGLPLQPLVWALAFGACLGGQCQMEIEVVYSFTVRVMFLGFHYEFNLC